MIAFADDNEPINDANDTLPATKWVAPGCARYRRHERRWRWHEWGQIALYVAIVAALAALLCCTGCCSRYLYVAGGPTREISQHPLIVGGSVHPSPQVELGPPTPLREAPPRARLGPKGDEPAGDGDPIEPPPLSAPTTGKPVKRTSFEWGPGAGDRGTNPASAPGPPVPARLDGPGWGDWGLDP